MTREARDAHNTQQIYIRARNVLNRFIAKTKMMIAAGLVNYVIGPAEDFFDQPRKKAKLIIDIFGAYFYSPNRVRLIQDYYNNLDTDGRAFVFLHPDNRPNSWIAERSGPVGYVKHPAKEQYYEISDYLVWRYPKIFSIQQYNGQISLMIRRSPDVVVLDLGLTPDTARMSMVSGQKDFVLPKDIIYHLKANDPFSP